MRATHFVWMMVLVWFGATAANGYLVGPPLTLEKLTAEADIIFKGTAISTEPVEDAWFKPTPGFTAHETKFKLITVIKGEGPAGTLRFRHFDNSATLQGRMYEPQFYHFQTGQTYIVFAKKAETTDGVFRQLSVSPNSKNDQGVLLCPDDKPVPGKPVKEVFWNELTTMLKNVNANNVTYAIRQLDEMSFTEGMFNKVQDFDRKEVLSAIHDLMNHRDLEVARSAIAVVGSGNPYLSEGRAEYWLATVGSGEVTGLAKMDPKMTNFGGQLYWQDLVAIANDHRPAEVRALAIRALGLVRNPALQKPIDRWLKDVEPSVRDSAILLLADFPGPEAIKSLTALADDTVPDVRACVAHSTGFAQRTELANLLGRLLADKEAKVRRAAAMSLLSFSPTNEAIAEVFRANIKNEEFQPLFLNTLAREKPEAHLDGLAEAVEEKANPKNWWGGEIPAFTSWKILFKYLQRQPAETVRSGKFDRYLDAIEKVGNYSSSEPRDIYAFYLQRGMVERGKKYREVAKKSVSYDLDYFFKQAEQNPSLYIRE